MLGGKKGKVSLYKHKNSVCVCVCFIRSVLRRQNTKARGEKELWLHAFLTSARDRDTWSPWPPILFRGNSALCPLNKRLNGSQSPSYSCYMPRQPIYSYPHPTNVRALA